MSSMLLLLLSCSSSSAANQQLHSGHHASLQILPISTKSQSAIRRRPYLLWQTLPIPTGAWWTNLITGDGTNPLHLVPYHATCQGGSLQVCLPQKAVTSKTVLYTCGQEIKLGAAVADEAVASNYRLPPMAPSITAWDQLSVTLTWKVAASSSSSSRSSSLPSFSIPLVQGPPYLTVLYKSAIPVITPSGTAVIKPPSGTTLTGKMFTFTLNNGHMWRVYTSSSMKLSFTTGLIQAVAPFTGTMRLAVLPPETANTAAVKALLDKYSAVYPTGGSVSLYHNGYYKLNFKVKKMTNSSAVADVLMQALPHHVITLQSPKPTGIWKNASYIRR